MRNLQVGKNLMDAQAKYMQTKLQEVRLEQWCAQAGLSSALEYVRLHNQGVENAYHNTEHCFGVALLCIDLGTINGLDNNEMAGTVLAALFHDFDHTASNVPDSKNIFRAIAGLAAYRKTLVEPKGMDWANFDYRFWLAQDCISITEFPFIHEPRNLCEQVIRDADLLYASTSINVLTVLGGLREEMEEITGLQIPLRQFVEKNRLFLESAKFFTPAADAMFRAIKPALTQLLDAHVTNSEAQ